WRRALPSSTRGRHSMQIQHDEQQHRFHVETDGGEGELSYRLEGSKVLNLEHTYVPGEARGQGVGDALVLSAVEFARDKGKRIRPSCPYVRKWLESHPEAQD